MELYFKDLISEEASLEKLVDDLELIVQGADDFARAVGATLSQQARQEVAGRLDGLKARCRRLRKKALASAHATDQLLRKHPYSFLGAAFAVGLVMGIKRVRKS